MRPTVHDIAAVAGVSLATVDRVLNQRPGVRLVTREKVEAAIREIGYIRDVAAANLAKGRVYPLVFIVPTGDNSFMHGLRLEVHQATLRASIERTDIRIVEVPAFDVPALVAALDALQGQDVAGVALVATDAPEVRAEWEQLLGTLGIAHLAGITVSQLAYGQQRLLELAIGLALHPKVLLLDEPAAGVPHDEAPNAANPPGKPHQQQPQKASGQNAAQPASAPQKNQ